MSRERDAYRNIVENARKSFGSTQQEAIYDMTPQTNIKPNYVAAVIWTSVVSALVCSIFMGFLLYLVNESNIEENLTKAANHAVYSLEQMVKQQNIEIQTLRAENKKIHDYLKLWTPINNRLPPGVEERWKIKGYGLPTYELQSQNTCREITQCLPLFQ